jgi:hypothetical protein
VSGVVEARGLVLQALGERPRLHELTVDPLGPGEVRIRMRATEAAAHRGLHLRLGQPFETPAAAPRCLDPPARGIQHGRLGGRNRLRMS